MTPSKSLMALGAAILLAAPCVARADDAAGEWLPVKTHVQQYFVHNVGADQVNYKAQLAKTYRGRIPLWVQEKGSDGLLKKVKSGAELTCHTSQASHKWVCMIITNAGQGGTNYVVLAADGAAEAKPQPTPQPAPADARPEGVSQEAWAAVVNSGTIKPQNWARAAKDLEQVMQSPKASKMRHAGKRNMDKVLASIETSIETNVKDEDAVKRAVDLSEKLAVPPPLKTAAPPPAVAAGQNPNAGPKGKPVGEGEADGQYVLNTLAKLLEQPQVQDDMAKRLVAFLLEPKEANAYVYAKDHEDAAKAELDKGIGAAVKATAATPEGRGKAAVLYFMLGEPAAKDWFKDHPELKTMVEPQQVRDFFKLALKKWTVGGTDTPGAAQAGPFKGDMTGTPDAPGAWPAQFFKDALATAEKVWKDPRVNGKIRTSIGDNQQDTTVPGQIGHGQFGDNTDLRNLMARAFDAKDMYENGAIVQDMQIPGTEPPKFRKISMKIYSQQTAWGPPPVVEDRLGIFDITNPGDGRTPPKIFGQYFKLNQSGDSSFLLDDRDPKSIRYKLSINGSGISFQSVGRDGKVAGSPLQTDVNTLFDARNQELGDTQQSYMTTINGQNFRVIPQGGPRGQLVYFNADASGHAVGDSPVLTTDLSDIGPDGKTRAMRGQRPLGYIGKDKDGKDQFWYYKWNDATQMYELTPGSKPKVDPYDPMPKPAPATASTDPKKPTTGGTTPSTGTADQQPGPDTQVNQPNGTPNTPTATTSCQFGQGQKFGNSDFEWFRTQKGFNLFTQGKITATDTNQSSLVCLYGTESLMFTGIIPAGDQWFGPKDGPDGGYLRAVSIQLKAGDGTYGTGTTALTAAEATKVTLVKDQPFVDGKKRDLSGATEYWIPMKGLQDRLKKSGGTAGSWAWVVVSAPDLLHGTVKPEFTVNLHVGDDVGDVLTRAVRGFGADSLCADANGNVKPALKKYIDDVVADSKSGKLKETLAKQQEGNYDFKPANIAFTCRNDEVGGGPWTVAYTSWYGSSKPLTAQNGAIVPTSGLAQK